MTFVVVCKRNLGTFGLRAWGLTPIDDLPSTMSVVEWPPLGQRPRERFKVAKKKRRVAKTKSTTDRDQNQSETRADDCVLPARLDTLEKQLKELSERTAPDTKLD